MLKSNVDDVSMAANVRRLTFPMEIFVRVKFQTNDRYDNKTYAIWEITSSSVRRSASDACMLALTLGPGAIRTKFRNRKLMVDDTYTVCWEDLCFLQRPEAWPRHLFWYLLSSQGIELSSLREEFSSKCEGVESDDLGFAPQASYEFLGYQPWVGMVEGCAHTTGLRWQD